MLPWAQTALLCLRHAGVVPKAHAAQAAIAVSRCYSSEGASTSSSDGDAQRKAMASKLIYRSKQRGFLELDLLVGLWADKAIPRMDMEELHSLAVVLDQENPDLFKWITGQLPAPEDMLKNSAFVSLRQSAEQQLSVLSAASTRAAPGKDWVRGWDDNWRKGKDGKPASPTPPPFAPPSSS